MLTLQNITYSLPSGILLFESLNLSLDKSDKASLIGNNGSGKSTLLQLIAGKIPLQDGQILHVEKPYWIPQLYGQYQEVSTAEAIGVAKKINALHAILNGQTETVHFDALQDDWTIEEKCLTAFDYWNIPITTLQQPLEQLSGGEKMKVFLAGLHIHTPSFILLDEPTNHLDTDGRKLLYDYIQNTKASFLIVSHDETLLSLLEPTFEISQKKAMRYGGNFAFYKAQKQLMMNAHLNSIDHKEREIRKAKEVERQSNERQQKLDARGKKKQLQSGTPTIMMNKLQNNAEKSSSKIKAVHGQKIDQLHEDLSNLRNQMPDLDKMKFQLTDTNIHQHKVLVRLEAVNYKMADTYLWQDDIDLEIRGNSKLHIIGANGSGKTTIIKLILNNIKPSKGVIYNNLNKVIYIDQDYQLMHTNLSIFEQIQQYNHDRLLEHEVKIKLTHFLFFENDWDKSCNVLSGGEKMRLLLCCLTISKIQPELIILDEPSNNIDIQSTEILINTLNSYKGAIIAVSHDKKFISSLEAFSTELHLIKNKLKI